MVGGLDRVYEIGKQFRNEGMDGTHNPEFSTCEFYMAYANLEDVMGMTEDLLRSMAVALTGGTAVGAGVDFGPAFRRISIPAALEEGLGQPLPDLAALSYDAAVDALLDLCALARIGLGGGGGGGGGGTRSPGHGSCVARRGRRGQDAVVSGGQADWPFRRAAVPPADVPAGPPHGHEPAGQGPPDPARVRQPLRAVCRRQGAVQRLHRCLVSAACSRGPPNRGSGLHRTQRPRGAARALSVATQCLFLAVYPQN